jgi:hypothetical protein
LVNPSGELCDSGEVSLVSSRVKTVINKEKYLGGKFLMTIMVSTQVLQMLAEGLEDSGVVFNLAQPAGNRLQVYKGTIPDVTTFTEAAYAGDLLASWDGGAGSLTLPRSGATNTLSGFGSFDTTATGTGTATYAIIRGNTGRFIMMDVSENGGGGAVQLSTTNIVTGQTVTFLNCTLTWQVA